MAIRRKGENLIHKTNFKRAVKNARRAMSTGADDAATTLSQAQSALDRAAKSKTIHPNKAARLKSRLAKTAVVEAAPAKKEVRKRATTTRKPSTKKA